MHAQLLSCVQPFAIPRTVAAWAPLFVEFPRQEYKWVEISFSREITLQKIN